VTALASLFSMLDRVKNFTNAPEATAPLGTTKRRLIKDSPNQKFGGLSLAFKALARRGRT
jgi:hypothetical protein